MQTIREGIQAALDYVEANLTEDIDVHDVAARAYVSAFHFQRIFSALCGMPLGEYIRCRRLTLAAQELTRGGKVIDAAMKYGYESPDAFAKAFQKIGIVKYDAYQQMGGLLSFSLALLDEDNNGLILNSVHSTEGCYTYTKEVVYGECKLELSNEEKVALDQAMGV